MSLVGDIILAGRELNADMPAQITVPIVSSVVSDPSSGVTLTAGNYYVKCCFITPWGQGALSAEFGPIVVDATHQINITFTLPPSPVTYLRAYYGTVSGQQSQFQDRFIRSTNFDTGVDNTNVGAAQPFTIGTAGIGGAPPTRNTGWLPDSDGTFASAGVLFRWLNEGLSRLSKIVGGIEDETGLSSVAGQGTYTLTNQWLRLTHGWYDGIPLYFANKGDVYKKNTSKGTSSLCTLTQNGRRQVVELYPQPDRTAATNYALVTDNGSTMTLNTVSGLLPSGLMKFQAATGTGGTFPDVASYPFDSSYEIISYSGISGNVLQGCQRGLAGTVPNSATASASLFTGKELNVRFYGRRQPRLYNVGASFTYLDVPPTWETLLPLYLSYKYKLAGQEMQEASSMLQEFEREAVTMQRRDMQLAGPRQIGGPSGMNETYGGTIYGRWIVP